MENSTVTPTVVFHYVTENESGEKEISSVTVTSDSGKDAQLTEGRYRGSVTKKLASKLRLTKLEAQKEAGLVQLVYWRVELVKDDKVLASKEKGGAVKSQLPENWWK